MYTSLCFLLCFGFAKCHYSNIPQITEIEADIRSIKDAQASIYGAMDTIETDVALKIENLALIIGAKKKPADDIDAAEYETRLTALEDTVDSLKKYLMKEKRNDIDLKRRSETAIDQINVKVEEAKELVGSTKDEISKTVSDFEVELESVNESAQRNMNVEGVIMYGGVGTACSAGNDACAVDKSECRQGRCQCEVGYSYYARAQQCVTSCLDFGSSFQSIRNWVIRGHNDNVVQNVTLSECKQGCIDAADFVCRSIDYFQTLQECYLSSVTKLAPEAADYWEYNSIGCHFQRDFPLKEISVDITILGFVAEVTSSLLYTNNETNPIKAEFTFPLDDSSAVFRFEAEIEGRHIVAEIQEKEQAKLAYDDAIKRGSTAMLLKEEDRVGDIFQCTLGNLPPQTDARVTFSYVIELPQEPDGKIRFTLPTVLNPRYSSDARGTTPAEGATYSLPQTIPYEFSMGATIRGSNKVLSVTSVQDKLNVESPDNESTLVSLAEEFKFDHDLSFLVEYENCYTPQVILEKGNTEAAGMMKEDLLMVNFYPELKETAMTSSGEYIFVIDRSGSMRGQRIQDAKEALLLFLKSLPTDCYFNIISFGSSYSSFFEPESSKYTEESLSEAFALQNSMDANMGGTEIYRPLKHIFRKNTIKGHPRQVFLLTDGEVYDTEKVIGLVTSNSHNTRVFTLGIGSGVSTSLIKGVARAGNGKAEFIADNHRIQQKIVSLLKCATQPSLSDIEIKWNLPKAITPVPIPKQPPSFIHVGERLCLYALLTGLEPEILDEPCSVIISGHCDGRQVEHSMRFTLTSKDQRNQSTPLHRLAAKAQIKILETEEAELIDKEGFDANNRRRLAKLGQDILSLSTNANIVSKMTAFVAIDKDSKKQVEGVMVKRSFPVPVATPEILNILNDMQKEGGGGYGIESGFEKYVPQRMLCRQQKTCEYRSQDRSRSRSPSTPRPQKSRGDQMLDMISLQELTGYWKNTNNVTFLLHISDHPIHMIKATNTLLQDEDVIVTLAVIAWLRSKFNKRHDEWVMIEKKAMNWLRAKLTQGEYIDTLVDEVKKQLWPDLGSMTT